MPRSALALVPVTVALGLAATWVAYGPDTVHLGGEDLTSLWLADFATGLTIATAGFAAWARFPASRVGALLVLTGMAWFLGDFRWSEIEIIAWLAAQLVLLHRGVLIHALVTYPSGRATSPGQLVAVGLAYGAALLPAVWADPATTAILAAVFSGVTVRAWAGARGVVRRARAVAAIVAVSLSALLLAGVAARALLTPTSVARPALLVDEVALAMAAVILSLGLTRTRVPRPDVADVVVEVARGRSGTFAEALARLLGDPDLELGYWLPDRRQYLTARGRPLDPDQVQPTRAVTRVDQAGQPIALIVHDAAVLEDASLVDAVRLATRLAAANERLQAEARAQAAELAASRLRLVAAEDDVRRDLEHRLRSGVMHEIEAIVATLDNDVGVAAGSSTATRAAVDRAREQAVRTLDDFAVLARGLYPGELVEMGLAGSLEVLARRSAVPARLSVTVGQVDPGVAAAAWFICSEALANVAKHAHASSVSMSVRSVGDFLQIDIEDDGVGGADMAGGTGLRGLTARAAAMGGAVSVDSPAGQGTHLRASIPLTTGERSVEGEVDPVASTSNASRNTLGRTDGGAFESS